VALIVEACSEPATTKAVARIATLRYLFPMVVPRVPAFHAFMSELVADQRDHDIERIMSEPGVKRPAVRVDRWYLLG